MEGISIAIGALVGLIIFLYGLENFSREILLATGKRFRNLLQKLTKSRLSSTFVGTFITAILQSSTATTVIAVSLVSGGLISFYSSLGIIFGANIGTTITAQLVALNVTKFAPLFMIFGFFIDIFSKKYKIFGKGLFYFGLLFFGLSLVSESIEPIKDSVIIMNIFASLTNVFLAIFVGFLVTAIVQSSSVTTGIVIVLASNGIITLGQGLPLLLGSNIGTTVTTLIAGSRLNLHAKRSAVAHTLFNIVGVLIILPLLIPFTNLIALIGGSQAQQIANAHTIFNVMIAGIFLIFIKPFCKLVEKLVTGEDEEILLKTKFITSPLSKNKKTAFNLIEKEIQYSLEIVYKLYSSSMSYLRISDHNDHMRVKKLEVLSDILDESIEKSLLDLSKKTLSKLEAKKIIILIRLSNSIEQLSDIADEISNLPKLKEIKLKEEHYVMISPINDKLEYILGNIHNSFKSTNELKKIILESKRINSLISKSYKYHISKLKNKTVYSGATFVETISLLESFKAKLDEVLVLIREYKSKR